MKLAVNKKKKGSLLNLYLHELDGIFLPTIITTIILVFLKEAFFGIEVYQIKGMYHNGKHSLKMLFESKTININNFNHISVDSLKLYLSISIALICAIAFYIWFKEWFGRKKTIMTLMTLPISRLKIIVSKLFSVITYGFIVLGLGFTTLFLEDKVLTFIVKTDVNLVEFVIKHISQPYFPLNLKNIFILCSLSVTAISFIFLLIMINRSSLIIGTIIDIFLIALAFILIIGFFILNNFTLDYMYSDILILASVIITIILIIITNLLFKNTVHV